MLSYHKKSSRRLVWFFFIIVIIWMGLEGCRERMTPKERTDEEKDMLAYMEQKYKQKFEVGTIEKDNRGTGGTFIVGELYDAADNLVRLERSTHDEYRGQYEEWYNRVILGRLLMEHYEGNVVEIDDSATFFANGWTDEIISMNTKFAEVDRKKASPHFSITLLVTAGYKREDYYKKIHSFIKKLSTEGFKDVRIEIKFVLKENEKYVRDYVGKRRMDDRYSKKDEPQGDYDAYKNVVLDSLTYHSKSHPFEDHPDFVKKLFKEEYKGAN